MTNQPGKLHPSPFALSRHASASAVSEPFTTYLSTFGPREILGVIGPNGAGKTTLFNLIAGNTSLTSGKVEFRGRNISSMPPHRRARLGIGRTFQLVKPFGSMSTYDNIVVGGTGAGLSLRRARARADELIEQFHLERQARQYGGSLNAVEGKRLEVARALAVDPEVVLLDEIFSGLTDTEVGELGGARLWPAQPGQDRSAYRTQRQRHTKCDESGGRAVCR